MIEFDVDMGYLLECDELDKVVLNDEDGEHEPMEFILKDAATVGERNPDGLPIGLTVSNDGNLLNWVGENYVRQDAATVGRGNLTAEQVREAIMSADRWRKPMGDTGMTNTHLIIRDDGWQAIADELNATGGRRDTMWLWPEWEQVLFANVSDEVAQDNLNECVHDLLDKAATVGAGTCHVKAAQKLGDLFGFSLSCGHSMVNQFDDRPDYCPWCGAKVMDE